MDDNPDVTVESCITGCAAQNHTIAGIEFSGAFTFARRAFLMV